MIETERIEHAIVSADNGTELYELAKSMLATGSSRDEIANAIEAVRERMREANRWEERHEDRFVDIGDALYGWCHASVNLCPPD